MVTRILLVLPAILFWIIICFIPHGPGENYYHLLGWVSAAGLSAIVAMVSLYFAVKAKKDAIWWFIFMVSSSPIIWFVLAPYYYVVPQPYD